MFEIPRIYLEIPGLMDPVGMHDQGTSLGSLQNALMEFAEGQDAEVWWSHEPMDFD